MRGNRRRPGERKTRETESGHLLHLLSAAASATGIRSVVVLVLALQSAMSRRIDLSNGGEARAAAAAVGTGGGAATYLLDLGGGVAGGGAAVLAQLLPDEPLVDEGGPPELGQHQPRHQGQLHRVPYRNPSRSEAAESINSQGNTIEIARVPSSYSDGEMGEMKYQPVEDGLRHHLHEGEEGVEYPVGEPLLVVDLRRALDRPDRCVPGITNHHHKPTGARNAGHLRREKPRTRYKKTALTEDTRA